MGLGPLGIKVSQYIQDKKSMETISAVDINPDLLHKDLGFLTRGIENGVRIEKSLKDVSNLDKVDIVVLTTSSSLHSIASQLEELLDYNLPVVSTCEELTYPWHKDAGISESLDRKAKEKGVAVLSTGVNPGFLMDTLPSMLTGVSKEVNHIVVNRFQDARTRRVPFQQKIGAGLSLSEFDQRKKNGSLRHVGLTESMHFIADAVGMEIDSTEDIITPVIAKEEIVTEAMTIPHGYAMGVRQEGRAYNNGEEKIKLIFEAAVGSGTSYDEVIISGMPDIHSRIEGGVNGDVATCSIVLNAIPNVLAASPGLKTMADISIVSFKA